jgi:glycosyltransferase involved in cell wall biosynthesis
MTGSTEPGSISVVVPTYNDVGRIGAALEGIVSQTLRPLEIVVSDDCSDDDTGGFVERFAAERAGGIPIRYTRLPSRSRDLSARNAGIALARGEWIANCDSDDVWAANKLQRQMEFVAGWHGSRPLALLGTYGWNVNDTMKVLSVARMGPTSEQEYERVLEDGELFFVIHSSALYRRADYDALGGYRTEYGAANEWDFFARMADRGAVLNIPEPLVYYRKRAGSMQLDLFWEQRRGVWRLAENQRRRAAGKPPLDREQFAAQLAAEPPLTRLRRGMHIRGMYYYRRGATDIVNGRRLRGGWELALSTLLDPARVRAGVRGVLRQRRGSAPADEPV